MLYYTDGTQVLDMSDISATVNERSATSGSLVDLGDGVFQLTADGAGSGVDTVFSFSSTSSALLGSMSFFNYEGTGVTADWVALSASRTVETAPIPLPAAAWLLVGGIGALGALKRRKG